MGIHRRFLGMNVTDILSKGKLPLLVTPPAEVVRATESSGNFLVSGLQLSSIKGVLLQACAIILLRLTWQVDYW